MSYFDDTDPDAREQVRRYRLAMAALHAGRYPSRWQRIVRWLAKVVRRGH